MQLDGIDLTLKLTLGRARALMSDYDPVSAVKVESLLDACKAKGLSGQLDLCAAHLLICLSVIRIVGRDPQIPGAAQLAADALSDIQTLALVIGNISTSVDVTEKTVLLMTEKLTADEDSPLARITSTLASLLHEADPLDRDPFKTAYADAGR